MVFSSPQFLFVFLPIAFFGYFALNKLRLLSVGKFWLVAMSLVFYSYWSIYYLPLLGGSILFNFLVGRLLGKQAKNRLFLAFGIVVNLSLLAYFKYANFFVENISWVLDENFAIGAIALPLGISFFTFTQIAYLVDSYSESAREYDIINYALFVTFFPHLIAGPILHHREMMSQFKSSDTLPINYKNILMGLFFFSVGMFKKVAIADTFATWANAGYGSTGDLQFFAAWATSLSYTFQLYFDFSGYCDMAIGAALLFNIWLPINFNSPYKALDIQDFWRRWHITLSRFLRDYLYIPLGGNRASGARVSFNLFATFVLGGLWHGASWMFILWGALHGAALIIHRFWHRAGLSLPSPVAWIVTFFFVNVTWVFFRAPTMDHAARVLRGMVDLGSANLPVPDIPTAALAWGGHISDLLLRVWPSGMVTQGPCFAAIIAAFALISLKNSQQLALNGIGTIKTIYAAALMCLASYLMLETTSSVFLYFNF